MPGLESDPAGMHNDSQSPSHCHRPCLLVCLSFCRLRGHLQQSRPFHPSIPTLSLPYLLFACSLFLPSSFRSSTIFISSSCIFTPRPF
ncbi:hypothetical protein BDW42DRAFT_165962 [Aspergillus taichungensis]|uniref:Uncharacterized protein n=1 Tax=Aspergillus taichungensis TaxID=482145 RepID=A0A2J5HZ15_9EURO|nr:hypothetical protein BDW42DRAFT_165962 [Aspergillus taichungensis]